MKTLYEALGDMASADVYPFHMPGHKRNPAFSSWGLPFEKDITEIEGFDNLHDSQDLLLESQARLSRLYGTRTSRFLVNGSTGGILAAVSACVPKNGRILMARNCHFSVYHAVYLRDAKPVYLMPGMDPVFRINGGIWPGQVEKAFADYPDIRAVVLTSPSYDGVGYTWSSAGCPPARGGSDRR